MSTNNIISLKHWRAQLNSGREDIILDSIKKLRKEGICELIPDIAAILIKAPNSVVSAAIISFFNDLKDQECTIHHIEFLRTNTKFENRKEIIASCWQNGLDYSSNLDFFVEIILNSDFETAIEAFTVVEENIEMLSPEDRNSLLETIKKGQASIPSEKANLIQELISVVSNISGPFSLDTEV